jgi:hypothetical protein
LPLHDLDGSPSARADRVGQGRPELGRGRRLDLDRL